MFLFPIKNIINKFTKNPFQGIYLGKVHNSFFKREYLTDGEMNHHVHILGASGFGKSVLLMKISKEIIKKNEGGLLFIDLKGDIETVEEFKAFAKDANRENDIQIFSLTRKDISSSYNFLKDGSPTQIRDRIMTSLIWSEEYYKNQSASYLLKILIPLCYLRDNQSEKLDFETLYNAVTKKDFLISLTKIIQKTEVKLLTLLEDSYQFLSQPDQYKSLSGLRTQIESLILSDFSDLLEERDEGISLFEGIKKKKIILLFLDSRRYGETAKVIGRFILQDLKSTSSKIDQEIPKKERTPFTVIIDEFSDLAQEDFIGFLDRARSSKIGIIIAHQELSDLNRISPEFAARLTGNCSTLYAFLQKNGDSAEQIAKYSGTKTVQKLTSQVERFLFWDVPTGNKSLREVEEFLIHPNTIKSLKVGECISIKKYPKASASMVKIDII